MSGGTECLVSVVTPVYNGATYLRECIESVLAQTYQNWEYLILNNASTDDTLAIAQEYARKDSRIRVIDCDELLSIIANHNRAFRHISSESQYCKVVSADDWIYPECLQKMVALAQANPSVGIVGAYQLSGGADIWYVRNVGLSYSHSVVSGRDICRSHLFGTLRVLGNPTSVLYRADLVRSTDRFFPNPTQEADISACLAHLRNADFGFVHQILAHERIHHQRATTASLETNAYVSAEISDCQTYGDWYLTAREKEERINELLVEYYAYLSACAFKFKNRDFWSYHVKRLNEIGFRLDGWKLFRGMAAKAIDSMLNPKGTVRSITRRLRLYSLIRGAQGNPRSG